MENKDRTPSHSIVVLLVGVFNRLWPDHVVQGLDLVKLQVCLVLAQGLEQGLYLGCVEDMLAFGLLQQGCVHQRRISR